VRLLIREIKEVDSYIATAGFTNVKIEDFNFFFEDVKKKVNDAHIQFFDAELVAGQEHLFFAALNSLKTFKNGANISNNLSVETILFASAQRQITKAIKLIGVKSTSSKVVVLIIGKTEEEVSETLETVSRVVPGNRDDDVIDLNRDKITRIRNLFDVSDLELETMLRDRSEAEALVDLVIERIALLAIKK
jgi:KEOPS complex subunit Cgi121